MDRREDGLVLELSWLLEAPPTRVFALLTRRRTWREHEESIVKLRQLIGAGP